MNISFFRQRVSFLSIVVSSAGVETGPDKIAMVRDWLAPSTAEELRSLMAFAGYYKSLSNMITRPFADLIPLATRKKELRDHPKSGTGPKQSNSSKKSSEQN